MRRLFPALLGLAAACTDRPVGEDSETGSTTSTASTATTTGTATEVPTTGTASGEPESTTKPAEACLEHEYAGEFPPAWKLTCGLPDLCGSEEPLMFTTSNLEVFDPGEVEVEDLERARCMAAALRDRSPGQIAWEQVVGVDAVWAPLSLEIVGDAALVRSVRGVKEGIIDEDTFEVIRPLRPSEFFAACAEGDALAVWLCLMDSVEPTCLPGPLTCPE